MTGTPTYASYAADLRVLADRFDALDGRLPLPRYPEQGLDIQIHVASHLDVDQAAGILDLPARLHNGHTTTAFDVGTVHVKFVHVNAAAKAQYNARQAYAATMPEPVMS